MEYPNNVFNVEVILSHYSITVFIGGLPHVYILRKEFVGFQSWADDESMFVIEYYTTKNKIRTELDTKEKWIELLKALNEKL